MTIEINLSLIMGYCLMFIGASLFLHDLLFHIGFFKGKLGRPIQIWRLKIHHGYIGIIIFIIGVLLVLGSL